MWWKTGKRARGTLEEGVSVPTKRYPQFRIKRQAEYPHYARLTNEKNGEKHGDNTAVIQEQDGSRIVLISLTNLKKERNPLFKIESCLAIQDQLEH
ncbi:hypothetical protein J6590_101076 [Homalodisca vitripennis]|nr:hypothetical protein J6590_101076 [Homalodisca vitripennis]